MSLFSLLLIDLRLMRLVLLFIQFAPLFIALLPLRLLLGHRGGRDAVPGCCT